MVIKWILLFLLLVPSVSLAAPALSERDWQILKNIARNGGAAGITLGTEAPATCTPGTGPNAFFLDTDTGVLSFCSATDTFVAISTGQTVTLDNAFDNGQEVDGATSATPLIIGNGTQKGKHYGDASNGYVIEPVPLGDSVWRCWTNFNCVIRDMEGAATMFTIDPDAASPLLMYQFSSGYRPLKSGWIGAAMLDGDGTNCPARPTAVTINSGPKLPTFICADSSSSILYGAVRMPDDWDGGTITFQHVYVQTAADTSALNGDVSAQCHGNGETVDSTWGTAQAIDDAAVTGSNKNDMTTSAAVTPAGTCAAGDMLYFRYVLDATGTTTATATLHHLGFYVKYTSTSWSH